MIFQALLNSINIWMHFYGKPESFVNRMNINICVFEIEERTLF